MKRRKNKPLDLVALFRSTCGWCGKHIPPDREVFGGGCKARPGIDLAPIAGQVIPLHLAGADKTVLVAVAGLDSDAKHEGYDFMYMACCKPCAASLRTAFQTEIERGNPPQ